MSHLPGTDVPLSQHWPLLPSPRGIQGHGKGINTATAGQCIAPPQGIA